MTLALSDLKNGIRAKVVEIRGGHALAAKLESLGVRPGVEILKKSSFLKHGPVIMQVGMTEIAIGGHMAKEIVVSY